MNSLVLLLLFGCAPFCSICWSNLGFCGLLGRVYKTGNKKEDSNNVERRLVGCVCTLLCIHLYESVAPLNRMKFKVYPAQRRRSVSLGTSKCLGCCYWMQCSGRTRVTQGVCLFFLAVLLSASRARWGFPPHESSSSWMQEGVGRRMEDALSPMLAKGKHLHLGVFILLVW